ncbi:MAG TPA: M64 family metallopeptidase, partial [Bacteroidales bacterium]|nr:M64 family metallopeptidase [Bacteroidales bacterium]
FRCGNFNTDSIEIKEMFFQNNNSLGPQQMVDKINYGEYMIEAFDADGTCLFRRGYSSLFNEWKTTDGARTSFEKFEESVLIPWNPTMKCLVFSMRDSLDVWYIQKQADIPKNIMIKFHHIKEYPVKNIQIAGASEDKLDILFIPDGYTKKEMNLFAEDCHKAMGYIMNAKPFNEFPDKINFRAVMAPSKESGTDYPHRKIFKKTILNSTYNTFGSERYLTTLSYHTVMDVAASAPADHIIILVNDADYGGGGFYNFYTLASAHNVHTSFLIQHEMGHGLAGLGDEYYDSEVAYNSFYNSRVEPWEPNLTTLVDFSSKWDSLLVPGTPVPTLVSDDNCKSTGVFEGGGYSAKGIYRPACECTMKSVIYDYYCEACKAAVRRIVLWYSL